MIIHSAEFKNLHGHLSLALEFRPDVNVLIGINGTGKTSVLNAMAWILSPTSMQNGFQAAYWLSEFEFDEIVLIYSISDSTGHRTVSAQRFEDHIAISVSGMDDDFLIPVMPSPRIPFRERNKYVERDSYVERNSESIEREVIRQKDNPVLKHLNELHAPLYLPLNRRWMEEWAALPSRRYRTRSVQVLTGIPVTEILTLAERAYRSEQAKIAKLNDKLRRDMLVLLFDVGRHPFNGTVPSVEEVTARHTAIVDMLDSLNLDDVKALSEQYFGRLKEIAAKLGGQELPKDFQTGLHADAWWTWITEVASFAVRIEQLMHLIEEYQKEREHVSRRSTSFLQSINDFLHGKKMVFSAEAELKVELPGERLVEGHHLSSGEMQLLILFAFLHFQSNHAQQPFVVLVDEPELSLHVAWQHRYVESVRAASPSGQFIIATHSPEITGSVEYEAIMDMGKMIVVPHA